MKKNYSYVILTLILIILGLTLSVTLAYFFTRQSVEGVITLGELDFTADCEFEKDMVAVPNKLIKTNLKVKNQKEDGSYENLIDFYLRIKIEGLSQGYNVNLEPQFVHNKWFLNDGFYYFKDIIKPNDEIKLIDYILIDKDTGNEAQNKFMEINVVFEAIQFNAVQDLWGSEIYEKLINFD